VIVSRLPMFCVSSEWEISCAWAALTVQAGMPALRAMSYYERNLPHWHPQGTARFVTWRLFGSLPAVHPLLLETGSPGQVFRLLDRELDRAACGPAWMRDPAIADCVARALRFGEQQLGYYELAAYVVMPNHVHVVLTPHAPLSRITNTLKGVSARHGNQILGRTGKPFWQYESYDHWVRTRSEYQRIVAYIERNPVAAGLVEKPEDWPWSSARGVK